MTAQEIFTEILKKRGITDVEAFTKPKYEDMADPFLMADMDKAVKRITKAVKNKETVAVYGDYDIDGMTATTILSEALRKFGLVVETFIPDRFVDGYGLSERGIDELKAKGVSLLLTVDTGSLSHDHVIYAKQQKIDVIVTDHHTVGATLPEAIAVINPKRPDSKYPFKDLAGVGVAFTLIRALQEKLPGFEKGQEKWLLDLVALGTVCDIVPLVGENRIIVYFGLIVMARTNRAGLKALAEVSGVEDGQITADVLGWRFGPRLNASGRLTHAKLSMDLLGAPTVAQARSLAEELDVMNQERRDLQEGIYKAAQEQIASMGDMPVLVLAGEEWNHGVVGIVAARISGEQKKPTFVLEIEGKTTKGSARSFGDFHLAHAIAELKPLLEKGGGHGAAAGITIQTEKLDEFRQAITKYYHSLKLEDQERFLKDLPDIELEDFTGLDEDLIELMKTLEPYGTEHPMPIFSVKNVTLKDWRPVGQTQTHAKVTFVDRNGVVRDGIGFGMAAKMPEPGEVITPLFTLELNEWNGRTSVQHKLIDIVE